MLHNASITRRHQRRQEILNATEHPVYIESFEVDMNSAPISQVTWTLYKYTFIYVVAAAVVLLLINFIFFSFVQKTLRMNALEILYDF